MYKITINTSGKYYNAKLGTRYCLTRKSTIKVANFFLESECDITIAKLIRCGDTFTWSDMWEETQIVFEEDDNYKPIKARKTNKHDFE